MTIFITLTADLEGEHRDPGDLWGSIRITSGDRLRLASTWELGRFAAWWLAHRGALRAAPPFAVAAGESLAAALQRTQQGLPDEPDELDEKLYQFRVSHSLRFALRGADIPEILLGCNAGSGELSSVAKESWKDSFDYGTFEHAVDRELDGFLRAWVAFPDDPLARASATRLLKILSSLRPPR